MVDSHFVYLFFFERILTVHNHIVAHIGITTRHDLCGIGVFRTFKWNDHGYPILRVIGFLNRGHLRHWKCIKVYC